MKTLKEKPVSIMGRLIGNKNWGDMDIQQAWFTRMTLTKHTSLKMLVPSELRIYIVYSE